MLFVSIACANMLIPSYAAIQVEFNISEALLAIPDAFFVLVSAFFALLWGYYTDRIDRTKVILAGAFSWTFGMTLTGFSTSYVMLVVSRMLSGAGLGCVLPVGYSIISDAIPPDERSGWFGTLAILSSVSNGVGQALSSFIGPIFTWRFPFFLLSGISIAIVILLFFVKIPKRGVSEAELLDLTELNLEYSYTISKKDLSKILKKKTNRYLIYQSFFTIIPGTITIYFLTSMLTLYYLNDLPLQIRLQTATILAGILGIGYIVGNLVLSYLGDVLFRKNKKNRTRLAMVCMICAFPFYIATLLLIKPVSSTVLNITYPSPIPTSELANYIFLTLGEIFSKYPNYIYYFIFGLIGTILVAGPVANRNAVMIDINLPEHRGTSISFLNLSEQVGKGLTLFLSYFLISFLNGIFNNSGIFNMMFISVFLWIPACVFWIFASRSVGKDLTTKSMILSERKQVSLLDYIFELEIQMDRAIQKVQDAKYYILTNPKKFNKLIGEAIIIFNYCEKEGEFRSITNIKQKARELNVKATSIKSMANQIYKILESNDLSQKERRLYNEDLKQIVLKIAEGEKSTFGELQIYYEDANLKIIEARLLRKNNLIKSMVKILDAIKTYERVKNLLNERLEVVNGNSDLSDEDQLVYEKEKDFFVKCSKSLIATHRLKHEFEIIFKQLEENGINKEDLEKISDLTLEFNVNLYNVITDTFGQNKETKKTLKKILDKIDTIFNEYDKWKEAELRVF
ncbi:MAG: MFS transporter [Candidatus Hermodarchaeota archaeon]